MGFRWRWVALGSLVGCNGQATSERTQSAFAALEQCPTEAVEGVDVFDGQGRIDWGAVSRAGVSFAIIKATQGTYDTQATFAFNWSGAQSAGLIRSAYHFFDPTEDGVAQATHFLSVVGTLTPGDLPAMLDIECPDGAPNCLYPGGSGAAPSAAITTRMWDFLQTVERATAKKPIVYTFGSYLTENGVASSGLGTFPLALAFPSDGPCFTPPAPWARARFWQYSWQGVIPGIGPAVDRDRFLGSRADLSALAGQGSVASAGASASASGSASASASAPGSAPARAVSAETGGAGCQVEGAPHGGTGITILTGAFLLARRRRAVAGGAPRVLAGRSATPCRRPTSARA